MRDRSSSGKSCANSTPVIPRNDPREGERSAGGTPRIRRGSHVARKGIRAQEQHIRIPRHHCPRSRTPPPRRGRAHDRGRASAGPPPDGPSPTAPRSRGTTRPSPNSDGLDSVKPDAKGREGNDQTRAALRRYKTDGMTYEDVLKLMTGVMPRTASESPRNGPRSKCPRSWALAQLRGFKRRAIKTGCARCRCSARRAHARTGPTRPRRLPRPAESVLLGALAPIPDLQPLHATGIPDHIGCGLYVS